MLTWHDGKAMQLLDSQAQAGGSGAATAAALTMLLLQHPLATAASPAVLADAVRLACEWAVAAPAADFGTALAAAAGGMPREQQQGQQGAWALLPERVLYALAVLQALQAEQPALQEAAAIGPPASPPLQAALWAWLDGCAAEQARQPQLWRQQRLLHLVLLLGEAGLLCPAAYLRTCLALGAFQPAASPAVDAAHSSSSGGGGGGSTTFHFAVVEQFHPMLDYPSLAAADRPGSSGGKAAGGGRPGSGSAGSSADGSTRWPAARQQYACLRAAVLTQYSAALPALAPAAGKAWEVEWERLLQAEAAGGSSEASGQAGSSSSDDDNGGEVIDEAWRRWHDPSLFQLEQQLLAALGFADEPAAASANEPAAANGTAAADEPAAAAAAGGTAVRSAAHDTGPAAALDPLLQQVRCLAPWQHRHLATSLLAAAKAFLATTDSGGGRRHSPVPAEAAAAECSPRDGWLLQLLQLLRACCGHREVLSLLATCLNLLQRAVAAAVRAATSGQQAQQAQQLGTALDQAKQHWERRSGVAPPLLLSLLSAHASSLAASDIAPKLLPMLTGGLWRLQHAQHHQAARQSLQGQVELAAQLIALPGGSCQQWLGKMEQQHSSSHWVTVLLQQRAAVCKARGSSAAVGSQLQVQQQGAACLQAFQQRAQQLPVAASLPAEADGPANGDSKQPAAALLRAPAAVCTSEAEAAALAAVQHSLAPAALPAVLQQLSSQGLEQQQRRLLELGPAASQALLAEPQQVHAVLHNQPHPPAAAGSAAPAAWQLVLALFASSGGAGGSGGEHLLALSSSEAMAAAVAAATPATSACCWLLLRLLLDEQQRLGGHRLAEAERQLASR